MWKKTIEYSEWILPEFRGHLIQFITNNMNEYETEWYVKAMMSLFHPISEWRRIENQMILL